MIVSKGMEAYNQQNQPQSMMQMASGGIARMGYQLGGTPPMGIATMPMDTGQSLQVPQQMPTNFSSAQSITSNPLLNYGQPQLGQAGGTPLSMNRGGIARLGYQMGGEAGMDQMGGDGMIQMDQQQALQTIVQILIDNGIPPEQAQQLAQQILQIFIQGGAPAVEQFANQLEQQEQAQAMASGGIAGYGYRQGYGFGGIGKIFSGAAKAVTGAVKGVASAVKSVAKSPIGKIALTIAATYALGPAGLGIGQMASATPWIASAINAGLANTLVQGITTGKFNPTQALTAAALGGFSGAMGVPGTTETANATNITGNTATDFSNFGLGNPDAYGSSTAQQISSNVNAATNAANPLNTYGSSSALENVGASGMNNVGPVTEAAKAYTDPTIMDRVSQFGDTAKAGITNLYQDPLGTISKLAGSAYETAKENIVPLGIGATAGYALGSPQGKDESDEDFAKRQQQEVNPLLTYYGRNLNIKNPNFYAQYGAVNPFAPTMAANGGIMGYKKGGSMVPPARQIEGGVIELDARKTGGYIPYGKKERHDDVPAMLAKDEFVFTSKAVKAAGGGDAKRGAAKMYAILKQLEGASA
jgi:hypothetical protein